MTRTTRLMTLLLALLLLLPAVASAQSWSEVKKEFKQKFATSDYSQKAAAVRLLAKGNNSAACDMLASIIRGADAEILKALMGLENSKRALEKYAGQKMYQGDELKQRQQHEADVKTYTETWKGQEKVQEAAIETFAAMTSPEAKKWLLSKGLNRKPWPLQAGVAKALGAIGGKEVVAPLERGIKNREPRVAVACLDSLGKVGDKSVAPAVAKLLNHRVWQVRAAAALSLAKMGATDQIPAIINRLEKENGKVEEDLNTALIQLTGVNKDGNAAMWRAWYNANKAKLAGSKMDEQDARRMQNETDDKGNGGSTTFYGITTKSKSIVFVIDRSGSMATPAGGQPGKEDKQPQVEISGRKGPSDNAREALAAIKGGRKIDVAKRELIKAISKLPKDAKFTIIWYNHDVKPWRLKLNQANTANKNAAYDAIKVLEPEGATNIMDSVDQAFTLKGAQKRDENYLKGADTIFLLSDGAPNKGRITAMPAIVAEVKKMNATRKLTIHTIGIGQAHNANGMRQLAEQNGGKYVSRK